jgi:hypothetical protein
LRYSHILFITQYLHDARVCNVVQRCGYKLGFTIQPRIVDGKTNNLNIGRFSVSPRDSLFKFKLKVSGAYQAVRFLRVLKNIGGKVYW